ncbi:MAG: lysophospholipid acyltransferase family protein [Planctomycetota bacterium]|jgi:KDO2-lipid IV(A) lauroyltransferase
MAVHGGFGKRFFDRLSFTAFAGLRAAVNLLPWHRAYALGDILGWVWWLVDSRHRRLALSNLEIAFPHLSAGRRRRLAFDNFRHLSKVFIETLRYGKLDSENWTTRIRVVNPEVYEKACAKGRGVIAVSGHIGNWEWLSAHAFRFGRVNIVARAIHNPLMDREIRQRREKADIHQIYPTRESPREILKALRAGEPVCFLVDQSAKGDEGVAVPFFGRPAPTHTGPAVIATRANAPVISVHTYRGPDDRIRLVYSEELDLVRTGDRKEDVVTNTALFTRVVEEAIRSHPEQWFWVHDRWRIRTKLRRRRKKRR